MKKYFYLILSFLLYFIFFFLIITPFWLSNHFGSITLSQLLFNLKLVINGQLKGDSNFAFSFYKNCLFYPFLFSFVINLTHFIFNTYNVKKIQNLLSNFLKKLTFLIKSYYFYRLFSFAFILFKNKIYIIVILFIFSFISLLHNIKIDYNFKSSNNNIDFLKNNFNDYDISKITVSENKKNLILIYAESLERVFSEEKYFNKNLIKEIDTNIYPNTNSYYIEKYYQIPYLGFTISSFIASQCGIPLVDVGLINSRFLDSNNYFLPNAHCLSDIFKELKYYNVFMSGDDLNESNQYVFLKTHNYDEFYGINELTKLGYKTSKFAYYNRREQPKGGIHDDILLLAAQEKFDDLIKKNLDPFFLTISTLDTHVPSFPSPDCIKKIHGNYFQTKKSVEDSYSCLAKALEKFVRHVINKDPYNTNIVIIGDHLYMSDLKELNIEIDKKNYQRYVFNKFLSSETKIIKRQIANNLDFFPSILEFTNINILNGRMGLGYSIFYEHNLEEYNSFIKNFDRNIFSDSSKYLELWGVNK
jgi:phosphoglycerol transferase